MKAFIDGVELTNIKKWSLSFKEKSEGALLEIHCLLNSNLINFASVDFKNIVIKSDTETLLDFNVNEIGFIGIGSDGEKMYNSLCAYGEKNK